MIIDRVHGFLFEHTRPLSSHSFGALYVDYSLDTKNDEAWARWPKFFMYILCLVGIHFNSGDKQHIINQTINDTVVTTELDRRIGTFSQT